MPSPERKRPAAHLTILSSFRASTATAAPARAIPSAIERRFHSFRRSQYNGRRQRDEVLDISAQLPWPKARSSSREGFGVNKNP
jgi:hypothetical protein